MRIFIFVTLMLFPFVCAAQSTLRFDSIQSKCDLSNSLNLFCVMATIISNSSDTLLIDVVEDQTEKLHGQKFDSDSCTCDIFTKIPFGPYVTRCDQEPDSLQFSEETIDRLLKKIDGYKLELLYFNDSCLLKNRMLSRSLHPIRLPPFQQETIQVYFFEEKNKPACKHLAFHFIGKTKSKGLHLISVDPNGLFP